MVIICAILLVFDVNASVHHLEITLPDSEPVVNERFSVNGNNASVVQREIVNHVRHKHEQTIGNVHIVTNIDIANLITILNSSAPIFGQSTAAAAKPGKLLETTL